MSIYLASYVAIYLSTFLSIYLYVYLYIPLLSTPISESLSVANSGFRSFESAGLLLCLVSCANPAPSPFEFFSCQTPRPPSGEYTSRLCLPPFLQLHVDHRPVRPRLLPGRGPALLARERLHVHERLGPATPTLSVQCLRWTFCRAVFQMSKLLRSICSPLQHLQGSHCKGSLGEMAPSTALRWAPLLHCTEMNPSISALSSLRATATLVCRCPRAPQY